MNSQAKPSIRGKYDKEYWMEALGADPMVRVGLQACTSYF